MITSFGSIQAITACWMLNFITIQTMFIKMFILINIVRNEDKVTVRLFEDLFRGQTVKTVDSYEIALQGGVLNCITWNIRF